MSVMPSMMYNMMSPAMHQPCMANSFGMEMNPWNMRSMMMAPRQMQGQLNQQLNGMNREMEIMPLIGKEGFQVIIK
jgi:hypothetical protein